MKNPLLPSLLAVATLFLAPAVLSAQPAPDDDAPPPPPGPRWERFDANDDGQLDAAERAAAETAMRARLAENPRFLERADTDKDGALSDAEWAVAEEKLKGLHRQRMEKAKERRELARDPEFRRGFLLGKFDANHDHKLDQAERAQARTQVEQRMREHMEKQLARLQAADTDGDGKFSDAEWAAAKENFRKELRERHPGQPGRGMPTPPEA